MLAKYLLCLADSPSKGSAILLHCSSDTWLRPGLARLPFAPFPLPTRTLDLRYIPILWGCRLRFNANPLASARVFIIRLQEEDGVGVRVGRGQRRLVAAALAAEVSAKQKASANLTCKIALHTGTRQAWPRSSHCHVARSSHAAAPRELPHHSCRMTMDGSEFVNNLRPLNKTFEIMRQLIVKLL